MIPRPRRCRAMHARLQSAALLAAMASTVGVAVRSAFGEPRVAEIQALPSISAAADSLALYDPTELRPGETTGGVQVAQFLSNAATTSGLQRFRLPGASRSGDLQLANNFTAFPDFNEGIVVAGEGVALKIGGDVKADLIHDFNAIGSTDSFVTTTIPTSGPQHENARFHARQSRLSFDTRWRTDGQVARAYVEADFFGGSPDGNSDLRLRHAYGRLGRFTAGQTWTTFTDPAAVPATLDFEGAVSNVNRRQGLVRWEQPLPVRGLSVAAAVEDPQIQIEAPSTVTGEGRTESPDVIARLHFERPWGHLQSAVVQRTLGFQPVNQNVIERDAWGFNFTGALLFFEQTKAYYQITFGEGIGSYRGSPDVVATGPNSGAILPMFGWMVGMHHQWTDSLTSNVTFSQLSLDDIPGQDPGNLRRTTYLAVNLIANPYEQVFCGVEYLFGERVDVSGASGTAHRLQMSFGFYLP